MKRLFRLRQIIYVLIFLSCIYLGYESWLRFSIDSQSVTVTKPLVTEISEKKVLPSEEWDEHPLDRLLKKHRGKSSEDLIEIFGNPIIKKTWNGRVVRLSYRMDNWLLPKYPADGDTWGFHLIFEEDQLVYIERHDENE